MHATTYNRSRHNAGRVYPLKFIGYLPKEIDDCSPGSDEESNAVKLWQEQAGITVDGCLGPETSDRIHLMATCSEVDGYLTPNFKKLDFKCKDGLPIPEKYMLNTRETARNLEVIRAEACSDNPVIIISGYRSFSYNVSIGGAHDSKHLTAIAADIRCPSLKVTVAKLRSLIESVMLNKHIPMGGCQHYNGDKFVHIDHRGGGRPIHWNT